MGSIVGYIVLNGIYWASAVAWLAFGNAAGKSVWLFLYTLGWFIVSVGFVGQAVQDDLKFKEGNTPSWVVILSDLLMAILFVAYGHWIIGSCLVIYTTLEQNLLCENKRRNDG